MEQHCAFCGKAESEVKRLIASGEGVCICDECVAVCNDILGNSEEVAAETPSTFHLPHQEKLKNNLTSTW